MGQKSFGGWWVVGACFLCNAISIGTSNYAFSLFVKPLEGEFGWSRAAIMGGFTIMSLAMAVSSPLIGKAVDRYGPKMAVCLGIHTSGVLLTARSTPPIIRGKMRV